MAFRPNKLSGPAKILFIPFTAQHCSLLFTTSPTHYCSALCYYSAQGSSRRSETDRVRYIRAGFLRMILISNLHLIKSIFSNRCKGFFFMVFLIKEKVGSMGSFVDYGLIILTYCLGKQWQAPNSCTTSIPQSNNRIISTSQVLKS